MMDQLLTVKQVAARLDVIEESVRRWLRSGELAGSNLGGKSGWRVSESDLRQFMESRANRKGINMDFDKIERTIATPDSPWTVSTGSDMLTFNRKGVGIQVERDGTVRLFRQREDGEYHFVVIDDETRDALLKIWAG